MNEHPYFEIQADDMQRAAAFYEGVFGWQFEEANEDQPAEYWRINTGGTRGGLLQRPSETPLPECGTNAFVCSIEMDDFDETSERIERLGGQVALPKFVISGVCWQGYFVDPDGNTFGIFEVDETAT